MTNNLERRPEDTMQNLYADIRNILLAARQKVYSTVNSEMVQAYWNIGQLIVEHEQNGKTRAEYGKEVLQNLSRRLTDEFGKGFTIANLRNMRQFYLLFPKRHALRSELTWTHYRMIMRIDNEDARKFYEDECAKSNWSSRQLERQINSFYYERLLASQNKDAVRAEIQTKEPNSTPEDFIKDPYVLEFAGIKQNAEVYEKDLEQALINELQSFLLELGRGFAFVARQKHIDLDGDHFYIDLVFYNFLLKCFVLIDLKTEKLTHQDIGQMDTYVRIYDDLQRGDGDNPTIGLILCSEKNEAIVKYSILNDSTQIFASKYQLTLPTEEELKHHIEQERQRLEERDNIP